jgi:ATP-dependent RNA helicase DeaD
VATPGRLIDLIDRNAVKLDQVETVVLDEADEMLNMGFKEDMESILSNTPDEKVTGLFSATMPKEIRNIANKFLKESVEVSSGKKNSASTSITHQYAVVQAKDKLAALKRIIDFNDDFFGIIFCTTRIETQEIADAIMKAGYNADCLHGDLSQQQRDKVMGKFRKRTIKILCATDVAARGIDVNDITHVIHYHLPDDIENYTHRSGRTARAGKTGISIALLHIREAYKLHQIEKMAGIKFEKYMIPKGEEIIARRVQNFVSDFSEFDYQDTNEIVMMEEWLAPLMNMEKEELVARILSREINKVDTNYSINSDLNVDENAPRGARGERTERGGERGGRERGSRERGGDRGERRDRGDSSSRRDRFSSNEDTTRLFINLGKKDNLRYDEMRELIFQHTKVSGHNIKDIDMGGVASFFDTDAKSAERILDGFKNVDHNGREVRVDRADGMQGSGGASRGGSSRSGSGGGFKSKSYGDRPRSSEGNSDRRRASEGSFGGGDRRKKTFTSANSSEKPSSASKPRFKKKDDLSW